MFRKAVTIRSLIKEKSIKVVTVFHNFSLSTSFFDREFTNAKILRTRRIKKFALFCFIFDCKQCDTIL